MRFILLLIILPFCAFGQDCDDVPELNQEIVDLADAELKKKVGTGECWDLAQYVLDATGAQWDKFEVYGKQINHNKDCIYPGDIIQFEKVKLEWEEDGVTYTETMTHHTAIVYEVSDENTLILIHQNTGQHGRKVGLTEFRMDAITKGEILVYRPVSGD